MMHGLLKFGLLLYLLTCLGQNALGSEIIHGNKAPDDLMLYMVSVQNNASHICGGFLISENFVVTAAHCGDKREPTSVVLGTHNLKKVVNNKMRYGVKSCKHPSYVNFKSGNDIMLLKLSRKATLNKRMQPIQLPGPKMRLKDNQKCRVAGWGLTKTGGKVVVEMQVVEVPIINLKVCKEQWKEIQFNLPDNVICAGGYGTNKGFCQGDSGGPLVCGGKAVGVVSFNMRNNCDYPNVPNIYTDISKHHQWIKEILKKNDC
ncbi:trypsin-like [Toxotes jaculatrix]|uniref:trypsin-like n=1 Tax=Toxotes jaculatrix TaxID=941984 RepID=UPI001B3AC2DC|nr:trypsin-like [Toxotes jaculatrix]